MLQRLTRCDSFYLVITNKKRPEKTFYLEVPNWNGTSEPSKYHFYSLLNLGFKTCNYALITLDNEADKLANMLVRNID